MPKTLWMYLGYVIYFWIGDGSEPVHVHISKGAQSQGATKIWIKRDCVEVAHNSSKIPKKDLNRLLRFIDDNKRQIIGEWALRFGTAFVKED